MVTVPSLLILAAVVLFCYMLLKIISAPIRLVMKLLINAAMGFVILFLVNFFGDFFGISIASNFLTAAITGFFGIPGVLFLIILSIL